MTIQQPNTFRSGPDETGHFGIFGGRFVAETLMPLILELEQAYAQARKDPSFQKEMDGYLKHYVGRPSPLYFAERMTARLGGAKIYFKREELNHTGAHKVAVATPCMPAPVSAMTRFLPMRKASKICPSTLLTLCAPV